VNSLLNEKRDEEAKRCIDLGLYSLIHSDWVEQGWCGNLGSEIYAGSFPREWGGFLRKCPKQGDFQEITTDLWPMGRGSKKARRKRLLNSENGLKRLS